jgi:hypothetical protein
MKLETEFYKLPVAFDASRVYGEISAIEPWRWVPQGSPRYQTLPLVSHHGLDSEHPSAPSWPTANLERCPYLRQVLAYFRSALTDVRVRRVEPGSRSPEHYDEHHAGFSRYRLQLPLLTDPRIMFRCNGRQVHMGRGEVWLYDRLALYGVANPTEWPRVHLTIETSGSGTLWNLIERAERPFDARHSITAEPDLIAFEPSWDAGVLTENTPGTTILPPTEVDAFMADLLERLRASIVRDPRGRDEVVRFIRRFQHDWRTLWSLAGNSSDTWPRYRTLSAGLLREVAMIESGPVGAISGLRPSLTRRLHDFLRTGAFNPRVAGYDLDGVATPESVYELLGDPLMRLRPDGGFDYWNPIHKQYIDIRGEEIELLRRFATPVTVAEAADAAGYACDADLLERVHWFVLQHLVRPLAAVPGVALPAAGLPAAAPAAQPSTEVMPEGDSGPLPRAFELPPPAPSATAAARVRSRLRAPEEIIFRVSSRRTEVYVWVPKVHGFRLISWDALRMVGAMSAGLSHRDASELPGVSYDGELEKALAVLIDHGMVSAIPGTAGSRRSEVSGLTA